MAPWPVEGGEPKAPDKDTKRELVDGSTKPDSEEHTECVITARSEQITKPPEEKEVLTLDEGQLKALLDEAITYKNPKDREGKSELFKELLQEAEADESENRGASITKIPRGYYNLPTPARRRHSRHQGSIRECAVGVGVSTTRGGSLQNLNSLGGMEGSSRRSRRTGRSGETLVSARQREGGSLPTNVNVDNERDVELDGTISPNYTSRATLEVSARDDLLHSDQMNSLTLFRGPCLPNGTDPIPIQTDFTNNTFVGMNVTKDDIAEHKYASSICVGPVESGAILYPPSPMQHVSVLSIPPPPIHVGSDEHRISDSSDDKRVGEGNGNGVGAGSDVHHALAATTTDGLLGLPLTAHWNRFSSFTLLDFRDPSTRMATFGKDPPDTKTKSLDENGNALGCLRMDSNCIDKKKQRRVKTKNDRNIRGFMSNDVEGFRGGEEIDTLMEYIESPSLDGHKTPKNRTNQNGPRNHVKVRAREEDTRQIKRRTKEKFQRCNSLEEISKTKLEDLTEESSSERVNGSGHTVAKKQVTLDDAQLVKKSSWDSEANNKGSSSNVKRSKETKSERTSQDGIQESEFHVVTKKQRKRRKRAGSGRVGFYDARQGFPAHDRTHGSSGLLYQYRGGQSGAQTRRKSASSVPPSDKSDSSDLDSVHSLPVSSTTTRTKVGKNSVSGGSTPQASYADIARTVASPPEPGSQASVFKSSPDTISLPIPSSPPSSKKDAMTNTNLEDPPLQEYPPLEHKFFDLVIDSQSVKFGESKRDEKSKMKTGSANVISESAESGHATNNKSLISSASYVRPAVILMDEPVLSTQAPTDFTFGFEVNHLLLEEVCNNNNENCSETSSISVSSSQPSMSALPLPALLQPPAMSAAEESSLNNLVEYLSAAWEETMEKVRTGRARYYKEQ